MSQTMASRRNNIGQKSHDGRQRVGHGGYMGCKWEGTAIWMTGGGERSRIDRTVNKVHTCIRAFTDAGAGCLAIV